MNEKKNATANEPLIHLSKRESISIVKSWLIRLAAIVLGLVVCGLVAYILSDKLRSGKKTIFDFYHSFLVKGSFSTSRKMWKFFKNMAVLQCISLAVTPAFRMQFWNTGAEGQTLMGVWGAIAVAFYLGGRVPAALLLVLMLAAALLCGALWALLPAIFKAKWNTNETLFTLMMNYIATQIVAYFCYKWSNPKGSGHIGVINSVSHNGWLPSLGGQDYLLNILIVAALTVFMYIYLKYSKHGYELSVVGESENTARYIGINVKKVIMRTMLLSGALCGVTGLLLVSGTDHTIATNTVGGRGFTAIMVSWLAKFNPAYMILTSLLIVFFQKGAIQISTSLGLNDSFADIITGIIIFFIIGSEFFINYSVKFRSKEAKA